MAFTKTTADVPPTVATEFARAPRPSAIADATGSPGYTTTKAMQQGQKSPSQFGLPKSPVKKSKSGGMKAMPLRDTDKDKM